MRCRACVCVCAAEPGLLRNSRHVSEPRLRCCSSFSNRQTCGEEGKRGRERAGRRGGEKMQQGGEREREMRERQRSGKREREVMRRDSRKGGGGGGGGDVKGE